MSIRFRYRKVGGHYFIRVFIGNASDLTHASCGELVVGEADWLPLHYALRHVVGFVEDV